MDQLSLPRPDGVVLIESETGSGKTEAALRWATRLMAAGEIDGLFFAVPLRSAAVQLHARVERWRKATFGADAPEALLAVPGYFRMGDAEGHSLPDFAVQWTDAEAADRKSARWAAEHPKRYAASAFAVGTIDQALLAVLKVKHAHLRAACLIRHLLVVDEVHASDPYMRELVLRLIELFRLCGGQVLLMSATLGAETRELLLHGRPQKLVGQAIAEALSYPLVSASHHPPICVRPDGRRKRVAAEALPLIDDPNGIAAVVAEAATTGRRVLVLRNTVGAAIETALAVERVLGADHAALFRVRDVATLHHGRFAAEDRRLLDAAVEACCGRDAPSGGAVVVATQTLEQSLDVDFDLLVTDLCPIDVLLQRIGRLWRHAREGRNDDAPCRVLVPADGDLSPFVQSRRHGIGPDRAYADVRTVEATRQLIGGGAVWTIPDDNRRLVEAGTHPEALREIEAGLGGAWVKHGTAVRAISMAESGVARANAIDFSEPFCNLAFRDDVSISTRLGLDDLLLPLSASLVSPFGETLHRIKVPGWMLSQKTKAALAIDTQPVIQIGEDGSLRLGGQAFIYDRHGLKPQVAP